MVNLSIQITIQKFIDHKEDTRNNINPNPFLPPFSFCIQTWVVGKIIIRELSSTFLDTMALKHFLSTKDFGPSGVRALPLAAGINVGGHYFRYCQNPNSTNSSIQQSLRLDYILTPSSTHHHPPTHPPQTLCCCC